MVKNCFSCKYYPNDEHCHGCGWDGNKNTKWEPKEPFINKPCISEGVCREDKMKVLEKIKSELWIEGMNMAGEYQGVWVRYRDIERIIDRYMKEGDAE